MWRRPAPPPTGGETPPVQPARTPALRKPLVLIGGLAAKHRAFVLDRVSNAPFYAEPLSGLREHSTITAGERMIARGDFDGVIRIGNVPTLRYWRDLESLDLPVEHFTDLPFTGLTRGELHPIDALPSIESSATFPNDAEFRARFERILDDEPQSELAMIRTLSHELAPNTRIYLGNSLPIREWDLAAERKPFEYEANRGANGIDGQLSTFFGWCDPSRDNVCVIGDLTAIYDLGAPWIVPQLGHKRFRIVIINNGGGRIFGRVASLQSLDASLRERIIENAHDVRFDHWAAMWNIDVTELRPDAEASSRVWQRYDDLWR
jgi:2-succinyl-5-enolpyruvyl-6-hydroxy-3-cyclohexene-1-carboxylate synthase